MREASSPYFDPDFDNFIERIQGPSCRAYIDNETCKLCTVVKVDCISKQELLLKVVQLLTDLDLQICRGYIFSDARWFMDVFHVRDQQGHKLTDRSILDYIQQAIDSLKGYACSMDTGNFPSNKTWVGIEMTAIDRPGLFSEISAVLKDLNCNVAEAHAWTHNDHLACIMNISDGSTSSPVEDPERLATIECQLSTVLGAAKADEHSGVNVKFPGCGAHVTCKERRLHQLLCAKHDFDAHVKGDSVSEGEESKPIVSLERCNQKGYSVALIHCKRRPKLVFDTICTLTDLQYMVFHASIIPHADYVSQEYYIRRADGCTVDSELEGQQVIKCLEAAIERRVCEGVKLELCTDDRVGLLSDVTRSLREHGLTVVRADVLTEGEKAVNVFYIRDIYGKGIDMKIVDAIKKEIEPLSLKVTYETLKSSDVPENPWRSFGDLLKSQIERFSSNFISSR